MNAVVVNSIKVRQAIGDILNRVQYAGERFVVERKGTRVAAIVPVEVLDRLERLEAEREAELMRLAKKAAEAEGTVAFRELMEQYEALHGEPLDLPDNV